MLDSLQPHGLGLTRLLCPWNSPGKNIGVGCHSLLQEIFLTQGLSPGLLHCRHTLDCLSHQGSSLIVYFDFTFPPNNQMHFTPKDVIFDIYIFPLISSVQFSCSVVSNSLRPHESQHARAPSPSPIPGVHSDSRSSSP